MAKAKAGNALTPGSLEDGHGDPRTHAGSADDKTIDQLCLPCRQPQPSSAGGQQVTFLVMAAGLIHKIW
jgi:hypothetical protein